MPDIFEQLRAHEGEILHLYNDEFGNPTLGVGHNLKAKGISKRASQVMLEDDVADAERELFAALPWASALSPARQAVLIDMSFNLGIGGLVKFHRMLTAIEDQRWADARKELEDPKYVKEVGQRALDLGKQLETDQWSYTVN